MKLDHLHLHARDLDACRAFYERWFGFRKAWDEEGKAFLEDADGFLLAIFPGEDADERLPEWFHFGFSMPSGDAVEDLHRRMSEAGVPFGKRGLMKFDDAVVFFCHDPEGNRVEVRWEPRPGG